MVSTCESLECRTCSEEMAFLSSRLISLSILAAAVIAAPNSGSNSPPSGKCTETLLPVHVSTVNSILNIDSPRNQQELTDFVTRWTSATSNVTAEVVKGDAPINATYNIWTQLCVPAAQESSGTAELAVHGSVVQC